VTQSSSPRELDADAKRLASILTLGAVLPLLDATIITVAVGHMARSLESSLSVIQWTITGYTLAAAVAVPLSGWFTLRFGAKTVWLAALSIFLVGSVLCGISWNATVIVCCRALQGFGGGLLLPSLQTVLVSTVGPALARPAMGRIGTPVVLAPIFGPIVGGILVDHLDWRWVFYINIPICAAALALSIWKITDPTERRQAALDWRGVLLAVPGIVIAIYGLEEFPDVYTTTELICGIILLASYGWYALRTRTEVLINISLLKGKNFSGSVLLLLLSSVIFYAGIFIVPLYLQEVGSLTAMQAGVAVGMQGIGALIARSIATRQGPTLNPRAALTFAVVAALVGTLPFTYPRLVDNAAVLHVSLLLRGAGIGLITILAMGAAYEYVPKRDVAQASLVSRLSTQVGASLGAVLVGALLLHGQATGTPVEASAYGRTFGWLAAATALCMLPLAAIGQPGNFKRTQK
jgi:EmrB/QacA subfamily drug resistance transporter